MYSALGYWIYRNTNTHKDDMPKDLRVVLLRLAVFLINV